MKLSQSIAILYRAFFKFSYDSGALKIARRVFPDDAPLVLQKWLNAFTSKKLKRLADSAS